jgi:RimJ/RimL family protein N-acetyltransferase
VPSIAPPASLSDGVVLLRPFVRRDVPAITRNCSDPEVPRWTRIPSPYTEAHADLFIDRMEMEAARGSAVAFAVCAAGEGEALGALTVLRIDWEYRRGDLGYYLGAPGRGRGLMSRAVRVVCPWVFAKLGLQRLQLHTEVDNGPSQRVAEAAGFVREGVLRSWQEQRGRRVDVVCYSRLPTDAG